MPPEGRRPGFQPDSSRRLFQDPRRDLRYHRCTPYLAFTRWRYCSGDKVPPTTSCKSAMAWGRSLMPSNAALPRASLKCLRRSAVPSLEMVRRRAFIGGNYATDGFLTTVEKSSPLRCRERLTVVAGAGFFEEGDEKCRVISDRDQERSCPKAASGVARQTQIPGRQQSLKFPEIKTISAAVELLLV